MTILYKMFKNFDKNDDNSCEIIPFLHEYLKFAIIENNNLDVKLTKKQLKIYSRNILCDIYKNYNNHKNIYFFNREQSQNKYIFFYNLKGMCPKLQKIVAYTNKQMHHNNVIATKCLIALITDNKLDVVITKGKRPWGAEQFDFYKITFKNNKEHLSNAEKRHKLISDYVYGHGLKREQCNLLYQYISNGMLGNNGTFRVRSESECSYNVDENLQFIIIPHLVDAGYHTHYISKFSIIIKMADSNYVWSLSVIDKIISIEKVRIKNDILIIPDQCMSLILNYVKYLNSNNLTQPFEFNQNEFIVSLNDDYKNIFLKTMFNSNSVLKVNINRKRCIEEGLDIPTVIIKHIEKKFNKCIRIYDLHRKAKSLFDPYILKTTLGYIRSPNLEDYNWLCGTLHIKPYTNIDMIENYNSIYLSEDRSRNRIQALKSMPGLYFIFKIMSPYIDRADSIDNLLRDTLMPKKMKTISYHSYKILVNKKTKLNREIGLNLSDEDNKIKQLNDTISIILNLFKNNVFYINDYKQDYTQEDIGLFWNYINKYIAPLDIPNMFGFIKIIPNIVSLFFHKVSLEHKPYIFLTPNFKQTSLGKDNSLIQKNIMHLSNSHDITQHIKCIFNLSNKTDTPFYDLYKYRNILLSDFTPNLLQIAKQSKDYHDNLNYIKHAIQNIENRFSIAVSPKEQKWDHIYDDLEFEDGTLTFITNRQGLIDEAEVLQHCVWSYGNKCIYGWTTHIASIKDKEGNRSTIEFKITDENEVQIIQNKGINNRVPSTICKNIGLKSLDIIQSHLTEEKINILKENSKNRIEMKQQFEFKYDTVTKLYKNELEAIGYSHVYEFIIKENFKIIRPYLHKNFKNMTYDEAWNYITNRIKDC